MRLPYRKPGTYMQTPKDHTITAAKLRDLEAELKKLKNKKPGAAADVARYGEMGDFSENAEYQHAKRRLRGILSAITRIEFEISNADVIPVSRGTDVIRVGNTVTIEGPLGEKTYTILGSAEADPGKNIISHNSPLGAALIGKRVGDDVSVERQGGAITYRVTKIE